MKQSRHQRADPVLALAKKAGKTLATVESCTAGSLAVLLADAEGASEAFHGGFVVYTKESKTAVLGVPLDLLAKHTAVSAEVAAAMASGGVSRCPADVVLSVTGVAGPEPDEDGNPVGLVYIGVAVRGGSIETRRFEFGKKSREEIRNLSLDAALALAEATLLR